MFLNTYLKSLHAKHQKLEEELYDLIAQSYPDDQELQQLKKEKLVMKDKIAQTSVYHRIEPENLPR